MKFWIESSLGKDHVCESEYEAVDAAKLCADRLHQTVDVMQGEKFPNGSLVQVVKPAVKGN